MNRFSYCVLFSQSTSGRDGARGYSLFELLIALTIAGGLLSAGAGFVRIVQDVSQTTEVNTLIGHLNFARTEAIKRGQKVVVCPSSNGRQCETGTDYTWWHRGMLLFVDTDGNGNLDAHDPVIRIHTPAGERLSIKSSSDRSHVSYQPTGLASGTNLTFTFCDKRGTRSARYVIVSNTGRARVSSTPADGRADAGFETCS